MPEAVTPDAAAEYIIVESHSIDRQGKAVTDRKMYQPTDMNADIFSDHGDGLCALEAVRFEWQ